MRNNRTQGETIIRLDRLAREARRLSDWLVSHVPTYVHEYNSNWELEKKTQYPVRGAAHYPWPDVAALMKRKLSFYRNLILRGDWHERADGDTILKGWGLRFVDSLFDSADRRLYAAAGDYPIGFDQDILYELVAIADEIEALIALRASWDEDAEISEDGDAPEERDERAPYTSDDLAFLRAMTPCPDDAPIKGEYLAHIVATTRPGKLEADADPAPAARPEIFMLFVSPEGGGTSEIYSGTDGELHGVPYSALDGSRRCLDLRKCRKLNSIVSEHESRTIYLTPDDRWIVQIGEFTEDHFPSFEEIPSREALPRSDHIAEALPDDRVITSPVITLSVPHALRPSNLSELGTSLRKQGKPTQARLAELMADRTSVTYEDARHEVHDSDVSDDAVRKNVDHLQVAIEECGIGLRVFVRSKHIFREETVSPTACSSNYFQKSGISPAHVPPTSGSPPRLPAKRGKARRRARDHAERSVDGAAP